MWDLRYSRDNQCLDSHRNFHETGLPFFLCHSVRLGKARIYYRQYERYRHSELTYTPPVIRLHEILFLYIDLVPWHVFGFETGIHPRCNFWTRLGTCTGFLSRSYHWWRSRLSHKDVKFWVICISEMFQTRLYRLCQIFIYVKCHRSSFIPKDGVLMYKFVFVYIGEWKSCFL